MITKIYNLYSLVGMSTLRPIQSQLFFNSKFLKYISGSKMVTLFYDTLRKQENRYYTQYISIVGTPNLGNDFLNLMVPLSDLNVILQLIFI